MITILSTIILMSGYGVESYDQSFLNFENKQVCENFISTMSSVEIPGFTISSVKPLPDGTVEILLDKNKSLTHVTIRYKCTEIK